MTDAITCPYCGEPAALTTGAEVWPHRKDLHDKAVYRCDPCDAHVGCHPGTTKPLGRLADAELRKAKMRAHSAFDPLWRKGPMKRHAAYKWLRERLGIPADECHIGMFDVEMCDRVVAICENQVIKQAELGDGEASHPLPESQPVS